MKIKILFSLLLWGTILIAKDIVPLEEKMPIVLPGNSSFIQEFAAKELQYHLQLVFGYKPEITKDNITNKKAFYLQKSPLDKKPLKIEEARWQITNDGRVFIYGEDNPVRTKRDFFYDLTKASRSGTLYATYDFINNCLGIKHLEPGANGIIYKKLTSLPQRIKFNSWQSTLEFRELRNGLPSFSSIKKAANPKELSLSKDEYDKVVENLKLWKVRQRLGRRSTPSYGHAFLYWYKRYGKIHPEFFAMNNLGERKVPSLGPTRMQLCMSNEKVVDQIVSNWATTKNAFINLCPNDSTLFCLCSNCKKLGSKSDMMIYQANKVLAKAKKIRPDVRGTTYAYFDYIYGPKMQKVDPSMVIGFVSIFLNLPRMEQFYKEWQQAGNKSIFLRPNTFWVDVGFPLGYEKTAFQEFQLGRKYNVIGVDVDCLQNDWSINGIASYILARAYVNPEKSFEDLEDEYCSSFGPAKDEVKAYYQYIRKNLWESRVLSRVSLTMMYDNLSYYIIPRIKEIITPSLYIQAGKLLQKINKSKLSSTQLTRLKTLILSNKHAILQAEVLHAPLAKKLPLNKKLLAFRIANKDKLNILWHNLLAKEKKYDLTGMDAALKFKNCFYAKELPVKWYFEPDPLDLGEKEKWYNYSNSRIVATWEQVPVNSPWKNFSTTSGVPKRLVTFMQNYNGSAWYALRVAIPIALKGKKVYLHIGAIDETGKIYINGKLLHIRLHLNPNDWKSSFNVDITNQINWQKKYVDVVIKVMDKSGQGGMWKPAWLISK
jgi:hypothetical protein